MVESNVLGLIVIGVFIFAIAVVTCVTVIIWNILTYKHEQESEDKDRELELKRAELEYKLRIYEANLKAKQEAKPEVKDPEKASESDLKAWFDIMTDPDMLFDDTTAKEVKK